MSSVRASRRSLAIVPERAPLRGESPLLARFEWRGRQGATAAPVAELATEPASNLSQLANAEGSAAPADESNAPRALRALARIVDGGLCHRCGSCVGICPTKVLALDEEEYPRIENLSACTDCDLCVRVCPGDEFDYEAHHQQLFATPAQLTATHGTFEHAAIGYATDAFVREHSTSGGVVTGILLDQLARGAIDGAVVIASDEETLWKGKAVVARTREEILAAMKSKYAITATNAVLGEIRETPGRYALVGLPCQIHGFRKAAELDARLRERVVLTIGLFCHAAIEHEAYDVIWESLGSRTEGARRFITRVGKHPGTPHLELADGSLYPVYFGERGGYRPTSIEMINILYRLYTPERCTTCFDALAEFADIAVGDPWMAPPEDGVDFYQGWSFVLARTSGGVQAYRQAIDSGAVYSLEVTQREALACNRLMAGEKRWRAFRVIETHRRQGKSIPSYGPSLREFPRHTGMQFVKTELHMLSHLFCFLPGVRRHVLRFFLGAGGYRLLWLNSLRRAFRFWRRDALEWLRRRVKGRG